MNTRERMRLLLEELRAKNVALPPAGTLDEALIITEITALVFEARIEVYESAVKNREVDADDEMLVG